MDRANYRVMPPLHLADTREKAIENVRSGFEKWELYAYAVNPKGGAAIWMPRIEEINEGGRGAIGTSDDALRVLENYWTKTGGFGCILMLAHDWADWEATKRSYELFVRNCSRALKSAAHGARNLRDGWRSLYYTASRACVQVAEAIRSRR